ncbi:YdcF family protein [Paratractidigestivibacter sp.]|uniref:YdcF family protein n=1 Tax=Paratractidigestivibacter sp. TaxID=2847316 RepID=UPI002ABD8E18|nr:YdcF family protein [Paratractidigestivibacter sp.]
MFLKGAVCCVLGVVLGLVTYLRMRRRANLISTGFGFELGFLLVAGGAVDMLWGAVLDGVVEVTPLMEVVFIGVIFGRGILYALIGVALLADGAYLVRREGFSLAHLLPFGLGVVMLAVAYLITLGPGTGDSQGLIEWAENLISMVRMLASYIPIALFGVWISNEICYRSRRPPEREYVIVLGCGLRPDGSVTPLLRGRLDAAIRAYEEGGQEAKIICSGGQGADEIVSEARAMANYLVEQGIPERDVLLEDKSTTTEENLRFSRAIIDECGGASHCTIATNSYHCLRAAMCARRAGIRASCVGGRTALFYYPAAFFREYIALVVRNRYAVGIFFALTMVRFALYLTGVLPEGVF